MNPETTKPRHSENVLPVSWPFGISMFQCVLRKERMKSNKGLTPQVTPLKLFLQLICTTSKTLFSSVHVNLNLFFLELEALLVFSTLLFRMTSYKERCKRCRSPLYLDDFRCQKYEVLEITNHVTRICSRGQPQRLYTHVHLPRKHPRNARGNVICHKLDIVSENNLRVIALL